MGNGKYVGSRFVRSVQTRACCPWRKRLELLRMSSLMLSPRQQALMLMLMLWIGFRPQTPRPCRSAESARGNHFCVSKFHMAPIPARDARARTAVAGTHGGGSDVVRWWQRWRQQIVELSAVEMRNRGEDVVVKRLWLMWSCLECECLLYWVRLYLGRYGRTWVGR